MKNKVEFRPPDGDWGWLVTLGGFINAALSHMIGTSFAIVFSKFLLDLETSSTTVAWIYNMQSSIFNIVGIIAGPLADEFGWRRVTFIGALFTSISFISSAFAPSAEFLFFSYSILAGIGTGATVCNSMLIVPRFFDKKRGRANSILMAGFCIGQMIGPPFSQYLQNTYGFKGGTLLVGAVLLNGCVAACLFQPLEWHMKKIHVDMKPVTNIIKDIQIEGKSENLDVTNQCEDESLISAGDKDIKTKDFVTSAISKGNSRADSRDIHVDTIQEKRTENKAYKNDCTKWKLCDIVVKVMLTTFKHLSILKSPRAIIIAVGNTLFINGYINFIMMVPFAMQAAGHSLDSAAWCISVSAICNLISRVLVNSLHDFPWFDIKVLHNAGLAIVALCNFVFPFINDLHWLMVTMGAWGCGVGATMGVYSLIMIDVMGIDNMTATFGATCLLIATGYISLGPLMGYLRDVSSSYAVSMWISASLVSISFILWLLMPAAQEYDRRRKGQRKGNI